MQVPGRECFPGGSSLGTLREASAILWGSLCRMSRQVAAILCRRPQQEIRGARRGHGIGRPCCPPRPRTSNCCAECPSAAENCSPERSSPLRWLSPPVCLILHSNYRSQRAASCLRSEAGEALNWLGLPLGYELSGAGGAGLLHPWSWKEAGETGEAGAQGLVGFRVDPSAQKLDQVPGQGADLPYIPWKVCPVLQNRVL